MIGYILANIIMFLVMVFCRGISLKLWKSSLLNPDHIRFLLNWGYASTNRMFDVWVVIGFGLVDSTDRARFPWDPSSLDTYLLSNGSRASVRITNIGRFILAHDHASDCRHRIAALVFLGYPFSKNGGLVEI